MKSVYKPTINDLMCTPACPCNPGENGADKAMWDKLTIPAESGRVAKYSDLTTDQ